MAPSMVKILPDIIDLILDNFPVREKTHFLSYSLISKDWAILCRKRLFKFLIVSNVVKGLDTECFLQFLIDNPVVRPHIRHLKLQVYPRLGDLRDFTDDELHIRTSTLVSIVNRLPHLSSLILAHFRFNIDSDPLQVDNQCAVDTLGLESIATMDEPCDKIFSLLSFFSSINNLLVIYPYWDLYDEDPAEMEQRVVFQNPSFPSHLRLKYLDLEFCLHPVTPFLSLVFQHTETVRSLEVIHAELVDSEDVDALGELLDKAATHITEVRLGFSSIRMGFWDEQRRPETIIHLDRCTNLRIAQFNMELADYFSRHYEPDHIYDKIFDCALGLVSHLPATVKKLTISLNYNGSKPTFDRVLSNDRFQIDWERLCRIVSEHKSITHFTIRFGYSFAGNRLVNLGHILDNSILTLKQKLKPLIDEGRVEVSFAEPAPFWQHTDEFKPLFLRGFA